MSEYFQPIRSEYIQNRRCVDCSSNTTHIDKLGRKRWYRHINGFLCSKCQSKITNYKYRERRAIYNSNRNHRK